MTLFHIQKKIVSQIINVYMFAIKIVHKSYRLILCVSFIGLYCINVSNNVNPNSITKCCYE